MNNKVFLFNSIFDKPLVFENVYGVIEQIDNNTNEVKGAF